ncbi:MAG: hypothetical protein EOM13_10120 [Clostridia bacterium]|nr:hypothetical protein [Clostridia bacterium]
MEKSKHKLLSVREDSRLLTQALRYGAAAFLGFAADYLTLLLLKETFGLHYLFAVPLAFLGGLVLRLPVEQVVMLIAIEEVFKATLGYFRFRSRKWLNRLVDSPVPGDALPENELEAAQPSDLI